jgi:hypothetical protein
VAVAAGDLLVELGYATAEEMAAIRSHRTFASSRHELVARARSMARHVRSTAVRKGQERQQQRLRQQVTSVRDPGRHLAEAAVAGDLSLAGLLAPTVELRTSEGATLTGARPVAEHLAAVGAGARISHVDADQHACAVQLVDVEGVRRLHRYYVRDGVVERIILQ